MSYLKRWIASCPVCQRQVLDDQEFCRSCGSHLLLLAKVLKMAHQLEEEGKIQESLALYRSKETNKHDTDESIGEIEEED